MQDKNDRRLKIAIVSAGRQPVPPVKGGAVETGIYQIIKEYDKNENNIELSIYSTYDEKAEEISKKHKAKFEFIKINKVEKLFNDFINFINAVLRKLKIKFSITSNMPYLRKVKKSIKANDFDMVLIKNRGDFLLPICKVHKNVVIQLHNDYLNKNTYKAKEIVRQAKKIVCVSEYIKSRVLEISEEAKSKTIVNLNCVDLDLFDKNLSDVRREELRKKYDIKDDKVIMFSGRLNKEKGIKELLLALKKLPQETRFKLLIVGAPWYSSNKKSKFLKKLQDIAEDMPEKIKFTGYIPHDKLWEIYGISDLAVVPSIWEEPAGRVLIEAEAAGLPLVITDAGGMREYVTKESAIVVKRDENLIENLSESIKKLLDNEEELKEMGSAGKEFVLKLNAKRYYDEFVEFMRGE